jgi:hypothetical protein
MKIIAFLFLLNFTTPELALIDPEIVPIHGLVVEEATGDPLPGAMVKVHGLKEKFYTDFDGAFYIDQLKSGTYDIEISYISFEAKKLTEVRIDHRNNTLFVSLK